MQLPSSTYALGATYQAAKAEFVLVSCVASPGLGFMEV